MQIESEKKTCTQLDYRLYVTMHREWYAKKNLSVDT